MNSVVHKGHRERLKNRFLREGLDNFEEHNILELLLFFGIPYKDTNVTAHELLDRFGSFAAVFDADIKSLSSVAGMTKNASELLKLIPPLSKKYILSSSEPSASVDPLNRAEFDDFLRGLFIGEKNEAVYVVFLNRQMKILKYVRVSDGSSFAVRPNMRLIVQNALACSASGCVLVHNHPRGSEGQSFDDIFTMKRIALLLSEIEITLYGHYIVAGDKVVGTRNFDLYSKEDAELLFPE